MGIRIGDSARALPTLQGVGALQGRPPVRPPERPEPTAGNQGRIGPLSTTDREEIAQAALREPVSSAPAAAVRALGTNLRAIREQQPTLEERSAEVRDRFEQAREQVFGTGSEQEAARAARRADAIEAAENVRSRDVTEVRANEAGSRGERFAPPAPPEPVAPNPRILQRFEEPLPPAAVDIRG
jgi:hypothetical protein